MISYYCGKCNRLLRRENIHDTSQFQSQTDPFFEYGCEECLDDSAAGQLAAAILGGRNALTAERKILKERRFRK